MKINVVILLISIAIISLGTAYTYNEKIIVGGSGTLSARTDAKNAEDAVEGTGSQVYSRTLVSNQESLSLTSKYDYYKSNNQSPKMYPNKWDLDKSGNVKYWQNRSPVQYMIRMDNPGGLTHVVSIDGFCIENCTNITSTSSVNIGYPSENSQSSEFTASSDYVISGAGSLSESLMDKKSGRPNVVAEAQISNAHFTIVSNISGDKGLSGGDLSALRASLKNVNMSSEKGKSFPEYTNDLDEINKMFYEGGFDEDEYLKELRTRWKDGEIPRDIAIKEAKKSLDKGLISSSKYSSFKRYIDLGELGSKSIEKQISELNKYYAETKDVVSYNESLYEMYIDKQINNTFYLSMIKGKVSPDEFNSSKVLVNSRENKIYESEVILDNLKDKYDNKKINATEYLSEIKTIWKSKDKLITDNEYIMLLESESDTNAEFKKGLDNAKKEIQGRQ